MGLAIRVHVQLITRMRGATFLWVGSTCEWPIVKGDSAFRRAALADLQKSWRRPHLNRNQIQFTQVSHPNRTNRSIVRTNDSDRRAAVGAMASPPTASAPDQLKVS